MFIAFHFSLVDCGGIITDSQGNISSPSFPNKYPNKVFCRWHIIVSQGKLIYFKFTNFSVEAGSTCGHDFVRINTSLSQHTRLVNVKLYMVCFTSICWDTVSIDKLLTDKRDMYSSQILYKFHERILHIIFF